MNQYSKTEYQRKWLHQLNEEFRLISYWHNVTLATPALEITESSKVLGAWIPCSRTIAISAKLIQNFSWDGVVNVMKHEMAHLYVQEVMGRAKEMPHGPAFQEACNRLGVPQPFRSATGDTPKVFVADRQHCGDVAYERKIRKVRKMLSLASSSNIHEAESAMRQANNFIRKYNLERLNRIKEQSDYDYQIINTMKKRKNILERKVAALLMDYFYVDVVYSELFDPEKCESYKTIELLGTRENVVFAKHVYNFLSRRICFLWDEYRKKMGVTGRLKRSYTLGLLQGLREKLAQNEKKQTLPENFFPVGKNAKTISALVVAKDSGLAEFAGNHFPRLRKVSYRTSGIFCGSTYKLGKKEGKKITIHKVVQHKEGNLGKLISV
jgi:predicted SprT family Zn-dependent metalloprotease